LWSGASALVPAVALLPVAAYRGRLVLLSGLVGWCLTALAGVAGGLWVVSRHGTPGAAFLVALGVCMMSRLVLFVAGPLVAAPLGVDAVLACIVGLFAGYIPTQTVEVIWIARG
jgi:hypothetical protein